MDRTNRTARTARAGVLAVATAIAALTLGLQAGSASAHVAPITADCERGLVITLTQYDPAGVNTLRVWVDGIERSSTTFGAGTTVTFSFGDLTVTHTYRVVVTAWDDPDGKKGWSFDTGTKAIPVCATSTTPAPTTTAPPTTAPPTTTATSEPVVSTAPPPTVTPTVASSIAPSVLPTVVTTAPDVGSAGPTTVAVAPATTTPMLPVTGGVPVGPIAALAAVLVGVLLALAARRPA